MHLSLLRQDWLMGNLFAIPIRNNEKPSIGIEVFQSLIIDGVETKSRPKASIGWLNCKMLVLNRS